MKPGASVVGVDLGGTKILAAVVDRKGRLLSEEKRPTPSGSDANDVVKALAKTVRRTIEDSGVPRKRIGAIGVGAPAPVDPDTGILSHATNLPALTDFPLGERLARELELPVFVENDVNAGAVGEHALGAGRGTKDMVGIFVGTGVGGAVILDGRLRHGTRNGAGEIGHMVVGFRDDPEEVRCGCGRPGCVEAYASRTAIERDIRAAIDEGRETIVTSLLEMNGKVRITSGVLAKALKKGDPLVTEVMERATTYLSVLVATIVNFVDPEMVVLGGGVAEALGERLAEPIRREAPRSYLEKKDADRVRIVLAELGDYAGVLGAATIARQSVG